MENSALIEQEANLLMMPEVMASRLSVLTDRQMTLFEEACREPLLLKPEEQEEGRNLNSCRCAFLVDVDNQEFPSPDSLSEEKAALLELVKAFKTMVASNLFWDEPETNMNPRMMEPLVKAILALASAGVQVFITTHDYFVQQYFGLAAEYGEKYQSGTGNLEYRFFSLRKTSENGNTGASETIALESAARLSELEHNAIRDEFDAVYDREQGLIYGNDAE